MSRSNDGRPKLACAENPENALVSEAVFDESKSSLDVAAPSKYQRWGGLVEVVLNLPDANEALTADPSLATMIRKLDSIDDVLDTPSRSFEHLMTAIGACEFVDENLNRLNSPLLDALVALWRRYQGRLNGTLPPCSHKLTEPPHAVDAAMYDALELRLGLAIVKLIMQLGVHFEMLGAAILAEAVLVSETSVVEFFLAFAPSLVCTEDSLILPRAAKRGDLPIVQLLVEKGCDIAVDDYASVITAAEFGHVDVLFYLLDATTKPIPSRPAASSVFGTDVVEMEPWSHQQAYVAAFLGVFAGNRIALARQLLNGPYTLAELKPDSMPLLSLAMVEGTLEMLELLLDHGALVNDFDNEYPALHTPLCQAFGRRVDCLAVCQLLVARGAVITPDAVELAVCYQSPEVLRFFFDSGFQMSQTQGLRFAKRSLKYAPTLAILLEHGVDPDWKLPRPDAVTLLMEAADGGYLDAIRVLLQFGADVTAKSSGGMTALDIAREDHSRDIISERRARFNPGRSEAELYAECVAVLEQAMAAQSDKQPA